MFAKALYRARWCAEINRRTLKDPMHMDVLRGKTPSMVRKEIYVHALAYNLIRTVIAPAALRHELLPDTISFKGALPALRAFQPQLATAAPADLPALCAALWPAIAACRIGHRPNRVEPRDRKRRPKTDAAAHPTAS